MSALVREDCNYISVAVYSSLAVALCVWHACAAITENNQMFIRNHRIAYPNNAYNNTTNSLKSKGGGGGDMWYVFGTWPSLCRIFETQMYLRFHLQAQCWTHNYAFFTRVCQAVKHHEWCFSDPMAFYKIADEISWHFKC